MVWVDQKWPMLVRKWPALVKKWPELVKPGRDGENLPNPPITYPFGHPCSLVSWLIMSVTAFFRLLLRFLSSLWAFDVVSEDVGPFYCDFY